jgi:hypothetical protein
MKTEEPLSDGREPPQAEDLQLNLSKSASGSETESLDIFSYEPTELLAAGMALDGSDETGSFLIRNG